MAVKKKPIPKVKFKIGAVFRGTHDDLYKILAITDGEYQIQRLPDSYTYHLNNNQYEMIFKPHWLSEAQINRNLSLCWELILP